MNPPPTKPQSEGSSRNERQSLSTFEEIGAAISRSENPEDLYDVIHRSVNINPEVRDATEKQIKDFFSWTGRLNEIDGSIFRAKVAEMRHVREQCSEIAKIVANAKNVDEIFDILERTRMDPILIARYRTIIERARTGEWTLQGITPQHGLQEKFEELLSLEPRDPNQGRFDSVYDPNQRTWIAHTLKAFGEFAAGYADTTILELLTGYNGRQLFDIDEEIMKIVDADLNLKSKYDAGQAVVVRKKFGSGITLKFEVGQKLGSGGRYGISRYRFADAESAEIGRKKLEINIPPPRKRATW